MEKKMKIIIVGFGKVGSTLTEQLYSEGHDVVVVDLLEKKLETEQATMSNWRPAWKRQIS